MVELLFTRAIGGSAAFEVPLGRTTTISRVLEGLVEVKMLSGCPGCDMADLVLSGTGIARAD